MKKAAFIRRLLYCLWASRGKGVMLACKGLGLADEQAPAHLSFPMALHVGEHCDNLLVAEFFTEGGHDAL